MFLAFLSKYREAGLLLLRVSLGIVFIIYAAPALMSGPKGWAQFGGGASHFGFHSHAQFWGFVGSLLGCAGGVLMIFGLLFRVGVLLILVLAIPHAITIYETNPFRVALPSIEMCFILVGVLFIGPGKYSVDKN